MTAHTTREFAATERREQLFPKVIGQPIAFYTPGAEIYSPGAEAGNLYQIQFGCVRVYLLMADGRRQISAFHIPGDVFGFEAQATHRFFAEAIGGTGVLKLRLTPEITASPTFIPLALNSMFRAQHHLHVLGRQNATERVAAFLLDMAERQGGLDFVELPMPRSDIGDYLGLTIETTSRIFSKFRQVGFIRLSGAREVELLDRPALQRLSE
jgi:CRP/FNR family nitrogen fixation transcriptional regulator